MADSTHTSDQILRAAGTSLQVQRAGGTHRPAKSIGQGSARMKAGHFRKKLGRVLLAVAGIWIAATLAGLVIGGIGFAGVMLTLIATAAAFLVFTRYPRMKLPTRADLNASLNKGDVRQLVGRTELWLESQRPALPPPAAKIVDDMGVQLDALGLQLEHVDQSHPAAQEVRKLVGEVLPEMVDSYRRIPAHLRKEERGGRTPDQQLEDSLGKISREIDSVTRQLAEGSLDDLAIRTRYLDYRYGEALEGPDPAPALPGKAD
ncbi:MAG: hypothetical protein IE933_01325 [Sphingomonadales bacterium]|nr:hypothetical protein [Sphingomonadales bacterium]MBD3772003.1 hypothetical protein [Paracoccaceae bacterium]MBD3813932.1 hypothetical protein [Betaproteobacteria bacterium]